MKINLYGSFRELTRAMQAPMATPKDSKEFGELLSSISPDKPQAPIATQEIKPDLAASKMDEARARFRFPDPRLSARDLEREAIALPPEPQPQVKAPALDVKTPTILGTRRMPSQNVYKDLSLEERMGEVKKLAEQAGKKHGVDPALSMAVVQIESAFNPAAVSSDGHFSKGLMQLLDATAQTQLKRSGESKSYKPFDPTLNVDLGVGYLRHLHDIFSSETDLPGSLKTTAAANSASLEKLAVAAFNAGEGRVASAQSRAEDEGKNPSSFDDVEPYLPETTRQYVQRVFASRELYGRSAIGKSQEEL